MVLKVFFSNPECIQDTQREGLPLSSISATFYVYSYIDHISNIDIQNFLNIKHTNKISDDCAHNKFPQHTMKISSDCNRKVIICLITHFTQVKFFVMFSLFTGQRWTEVKVG